MGDLDRSGEVRPMLRTGEWETLDLAGMVEKFGVYYLPYRRLENRRGNGCARVSGRSCTRTGRGVGAVFCSARIDSRVARESLSGLPPAKAGTGSSRNNRAASRKITRRVAAGRGSEIQLESVVASLRLRLLAASHEFHSPQGGCALAACRSFQSSELRDDVV